MRADLHVHTNFSDGTFTPEEVISYALKIGLSAVAITDHDTVDGIGPAADFCEGKKIELVPGIELTAELENHEVHILGFFIDYKSKWFADELKKLRELRLKRMRNMLASLNKIGVNLNIQDIIDISGYGSPGRLHLAKALFRKGYVSSIQEAFNRFIGAGKPCYAKGDRINPKDAIALINKAGGAAVLAHPGIMGKDEFIPALSKEGLKGLEVYHTDHSNAQVSRYENMAKELGLVATGGSDCHGMGKGKVIMGTVTVPYDVVEKLKNAV